MLSLRDMTLGDKDKIREWRNLPHISTYMYTDHYITSEEHDKWFNKVANDKTYKYWIIICDNKEVGIVNLYDIDNRNSRAYWAFYIASLDLRGRGVGSFVEYNILCYVFDELGLNKLCCEVLSTNSPVIRMHKKFGFKEEGVFREHIFKGDAPKDIVCLAMLRSEWQVVKPQMEARLNSARLL